MMTLSIAKVLSLVLFLVTCSLSIPTSDLPGNGQHVPQQTSLDAPLRSSFLTKICAGFVDSVWPGYRVAKRPLHPTKRPQNRRVSKYDDDIVLRFKITDQEEAQAFAEAVDTLYLDRWETSRGWADIRISQKVLPSFLTLLPESLHRSYTPIITALSQTVYDTYPLSRHGEAWSHRPSSKLPHDLFFENYQPLSVLYPWLRQLASMFPDRTKLFTIGTSYEGRDIPALQIGIQAADDDPHKEDPRQTVLVAAGSHAREWISTSTAAFLLRSLLHNFDHRDHDVIEKLLTHYDFIFLPVLNPDGYEYTWTTDRLWRKNRQETTLPFCKGIDLDHAFSFGWSGDNQTDNPCSESYAGQHPLQAVEAQRVTEWARNETSSGRRVFAALLDLHSYSQEILYPFSYTCDRKPGNLEDLEEVAVGLAKAFRLANGHYYGVESACEGSMLRTSSTVKNAKSALVQLEEAGGSALDFFYHDMQVKYAFQIKLRDTGSYGFLLPKENIVPTGVETWSAMMGFGRWLLGNRGIENFSEDEIWGREDIIINDASQIATLEQAARTKYEDDGFWFRRRRR